MVEPARKYWEPIKVLGGSAEPDPADDPPPAKVEAKLEPKTSALALEIELQRLELERERVRLERERLALEVARMKAQPPALPAPREPEDPRSLLAGADDVGQEVEELGREMRRKDSERLRRHAKEEDDTVECAACAERIKARAKKCKHCGHEVGARVKKRRRAATGISNEKSPMMAALLSALCIPGLGQMWLGEAMRGLMFFAAGALFAVVFPLGCLVVWLVAGIDAANLAGEINARARAARR